ncbi:MAG: flavodoxin-dependent (E)-4-hydroxy-3-methylbut-2-enyl-diphosphate synthase, partial [Allobaculum sp.]|nr:flavodoxin-dependent (E)-4-hydroxy-3-methylbut-2-enyl-diphosphate synthase [Allobaculum sp.]
MNRIETRPVKAGNVQIGGNNHVVIQSMCSIRTANTEAVIDQILKLEKQGCELIRVSVMDFEDAKAIETIKKHIHIPLVADIH